MLSPVKTVQIFQSSPEPHCVQAGSVIFSNGDAGSVMYGLVEGEVEITVNGKVLETCLLYTSPSPRDKRQSRMPSSA